MPYREVLVVRELTKKFEETWRGPVAEIAAKLQAVEIKGECALVLSCPTAEAATPALDLDAYLLETAQKLRLTGRRLADQVAADLQIPRRRAYQAYLALKGARPGGLRRQSLGSTVPRPAGTRGYILNLPLIL